MGRRFCCFLVFLSFRQLSAAGNPENPRGPGNGFRKRSEHCEMDDFAAFVGFPSFWQLSAAENPENPRGPGNGFRKRSEHYEIGDFAAFVGFPSFWQLSAAENPENPRGPGNGFRKRSEHWEMDDFAAFVAFPSFRQLSAAGNQKIQGAQEMASGKETNIAKWTILLLLWGSPHFGSFRRPEIPKIHGAWKWDDDFAAFVGCPSFRQGILRNGRFCCFCEVPSLRQLSAAGNPENPKGPERPEEARKRPKTSQKRPGRGQKRPGRGRKRSGRGQKRPGRGQGPKRPGIQNLVKNCSKRNVL